MARNEETKSGFIIILNSPQAVYYPGQTVDGYVRIDIETPLETEGIRIKLVGKGYCFWEVLRKRKNYYGKETIVKDEIQLFGHPPDNNVKETLTLSKGKHVFHFSFDLPEELPSTFEYTGAYIRYFLKATIDLVSDWENDYKSFKPLIINDVIDINNQIYEEGQGGEMESIVGCRSRPKGSAEIYGSIDRCGFCPGETITFNAGVQNRSTSEIKSLNIKLIMIIKLHATKTTKTITKEIAKVIGPVVPKGQQANWVNQPFGIPAIPPSINNSSVISVNYKLQVTVQIPCRKDLKVDMNIVMGTVPNVEKFGKLADQEAETPPANFIGGPMFPCAQPEYLGYPNMDAPCLSAVVGQKTSIALATDFVKNIFGDIYYRPVYTFAQPYQGSYSPATPSPPDSPSADPAAIMPLMNY